MRTNPTDVIRAIERAFDGIGRPKTSLRQFRLTDQKGMSGFISDEEWEDAGKNRIDSKWQDIPDDEIEECHVVLAHMEAEEFRYYLPAYMRYGIKHHTTPLWKSDVLGSTVFAVYPSSRDPHLREYVLSQLSLLNSAQRSSVVQFLQFVADYVEDARRPDAQVALDRYWKKLKE